MNVKKKPSIQLFWADFSPILPSDHWSNLLHYLYQHSEFWDGQPSFSYRDILSVKFPESLQQISRSFYRFTTPDFENVWRP